MDATLCALELCLGFRLAQLGVVASHHVCERLLANAAELGGYRAVDDLDLAVGHFDDADFGLLARRSRRRPAPATTESAFRVNSLFHFLQHHFVLYYSLVK